MQVGHWWTWNRLRRLLDERVPQLRRPHSESVGELFNCFRQPAFADDADRRINA